MKKFAKILMFSTLATSAWASEALKDSTSNFVKLCVGGEKCIIGKSSLTAVKDNMLARMVCGNIPTTTDEDGYILIDGDGKLFKEYVAKWLRRGDVHFPLSPEGLADALNTFSEADYYMLVPFKRHIWEWIKTHESEKYFAWLEDHETECLTEAEAFRLRDTKCRLGFEKMQNSECFRMFRLSDGQTIGCPKFGTGFTDFDNASKYFNLYLSRKHHKELCLTWSDRPHGYGQYLWNIVRNSNIGFKLGEHGTANTCIELQLIERAVGNHVCSKKTSSKFAIYEIDTGNEATELGEFDTADACVEVLNQQCLL